MEKLLNFLALFFIGLCVEVHMLHWQRLCSVTVFQELLRTQASCLFLWFV